MSPPEPTVSGNPHIAIELGRVFWSIVIGEVLGRVIRSTGKVPEELRDTPPEDIGLAVSSTAGSERSALDVSDIRVGSPLGLHAVEPRRINSARQLGNETMSFDIVGDDYDDDAGSIGLEELIGDEDFLDSLIEGDELEDLISGDGSTEIVGASASERRRIARKKAAMRKKAALRKIAMRNSGAVVSRGLDRRRRYPLGFVPTAIAAASSQQIPSAPQNLYRPERLVIPSDIAFDLGVVDIKVGNQSQLVQSVEVPAALFSEVAINTGVTFDTAEVGNQVSVNARNKSAAALEFTAGLVGTIAK